VAPPRERDEAMASVSGQWRHCAEWHESWRAVTPAPTPEQEFHQGMSALLNSSYAQSPAPETVTVAGQASGEIDIRRGRLEAAAWRAGLVYPGPVGKLVSKEIRTLISGSDWETGPPLVVSPIMCSPPRQSVIVRDPPSTSLHSTI
jgi:hypothetical protein